MDNLGHITMVRDGDRYYTVYSQNKKSVILKSKELTKNDIEHIEKNFSSIYDMKKLKLYGYDVKIKE